MRMIEFSPLPGESVRIYPNPAAFIDHAKRHVLANGEKWCWQTFIDVDATHWQALDRIESAPRNPNAPMPKGANIAYEQLADFIVEGIEFSVGKPVYACLEERVTGHSYDSVRRFVMLLSKHGCIIVVRAGAVRTAYFTDDGIVGPPAKWEMFRLGMHHLRARAKAVETRQPRYLEAENRTAIGVSVKRHDSENFTNAINPWPAPNRPKPKKANRQAFFDYLDENFN